MGNRSTISRKAIKRTARSALKRHYLMLVLLCLISSTIGLEYAGTVGSLSMGSGESSDQLVESGSTSVQGFSGVWHMLSEGDETVGARTASLFISEKQEEPEIKIGNISLGRTRGVFASALNMVTSGAVLVRVYAAIFNVVGSDSVASSIFVVLSLCLYLAFQVCVINVFYVIFRRMVLETRIYAKVPVQRSMFLLRCRKWLHVGRALLIAVLMELAWWLTIVGGVIKHYAYCLTPYILAENPALTGRQAVTISRTLMRGHKWERFKLDLSFLPWQILSTLTAGILGVFYVNPYHASVMAEYYARVREQGIRYGVAGAELLNDKYLFERPDDATIETAYADVSEDATIPAPQGISGFLANWFGIVFRDSPEEQAYEAALEQHTQYARERLILEGRAYPDRLFPIPDVEMRSRQAVELRPLRHYSVWSLLIMFFGFSVFGWLWEVGLHLIETGELVNRGILHGPWLPIYGSGVVMILILLNAFRSRPGLEFGLTVVLCGVVEYFTSYVMEITHDGMRWWDYSGYFLNINGRICAEGLLVFGIGGCLAVYVLAPLADNLLRRLQTRRVAATACALVCVFLGDQIYSGQHPNTGAGVTDTAAAETASPVHISADCSDNHFPSEADAPSVHLEKQEIVEGKEMEFSDRVIEYLKETYQPDAIITYGSFADGTANENSDFDALVIADNKKRHDASVIDSTTIVDI